LGPAVYPVGRAAGHGRRLDPPPPSAYTRPYMRLVFLGTPEFAVPTVEALARAGHQVLAVVAQPDRPAGRGHVLKAPATKAWALARGVPVLQPEKVRDGTLAAALAALEPDVLVVTAYGRILGRDLLELAPFGALNVHASLLPRWRGAAPIQWAVASGDAETGVTIMQMDEGLDTGDLLLARTLAIGAEETAQALAPRLAMLGGQAIVEALPQLAAGALVPVRQAPGEVTLAPILAKEHGRLDFTRPAAELACRVRGFTPWPGTHTSLAGRVLKVHRAAPAAGGPEPGAPGTATVVDGSLRVACGGGTALELLEVQPEGKRRMAARDFVNGLPAGGLVLGT
jgi:methionyl-tRNA formyltransferase